jgi:hypothetical protein
MPIPRLDAGGITPEQKPTLKFYCSWTCFSFCFLVFVLLLRAFNFHFYSYFCFLFLYYKLHHQYLLIPILTTSLSILLLCYNPLFSFPTILSAPSHPLSSPTCTSPSHPPPTCHQTTPPSYRLTTCQLTYCTNITQPQTPAIPDTSILHYNRNTPKHTQGTQNQQSSYCFPHSPLPPLLFLT